MNFITQSIGLDEITTEEQRNEMMRPLILSVFSSADNIEDWEMLKMVTDFVPLESLPFYEGKIATILSKCDMDDLIRSGVEFKIFHKRESITNLEQIKKLYEILEPEDIALLFNNRNLKIIEKYGIDTLMEYGIQDLSEITSATTDLHTIKELLEKRPVELINLGNETISKIDFIKKYGIDNIIKFDEETNGIFSHELWGTDIYLLTMVLAERSVPKLESDKQLTYEEFRDRMYEVLLHSRDKRGILISGDYLDYDFVQGKFREEHPEIFIDGNLPEEVKRDFYTRNMTAEEVRKNPDLIQLLQGKDLSRAFDKEMSAGIIGEITRDGKVIGGIPYDVNMAEHISKKIGQEEFLKICAEYGKCLDEVYIFYDGEMTPESIRETIEKSIYREIKERGREYFEYLPLSFQEKYPDLFLPKDIDETLRRKFYRGELTFEDIRQNPQIKEILLTKDFKLGFRRMEYQKSTKTVWEILPDQEIMDFAEKYGKFFQDISADVFEEGQSYEEKEKVIQENIEANILSRKSAFNETVPEFFKLKHPEMFLDEQAPEELKRAFYDNRASRGVNRSGEERDISFGLIKEHPEWREFLQEKDLRRAFSAEYEELFKRFDSKTLMRLGNRNPETIEKMVQSHKEEDLLTWYKATGGKFVPHHVVMLNFPIEEIDKFLASTKLWTQLMKIDRYNLNDEGKTSMLKVAYNMGVFHENDEGFTKAMELFTGIPEDLSAEEYEQVIKKIGYSKEKIELFEEVYKVREDGKYGLKINKQQDKKKTKEIRELLEKSGISRILTPEKAHQMLDSFSMEYNPDFVKFFFDNIEQILLDSESIKSIAAIQRNFKEIARVNAARFLTLEVAQDYVKTITYKNIEIGNEEVAEQAKIVGYSQEDFEKIQELYNEGETREFSSIPRIQGEWNGYTYEMLRCDDPLALTIGTLTDCCQEINGAGQTSMEHSVLSPDGRVFCVRDSEGRIVAQSWFWRNQYTGCFDNIEIPGRIFKLYEKEHPKEKRKGLTSDVLEVYKKAAQDLMKEDERVYQELLESGTITQEQYDALLLGKITIGLGYNDIADAIVTDKTIHKVEESDRVMVKGTERLGYPYTDAALQYSIAERDGIKKSDHENLYVHQDSIPVYDGTNMSSTVLLTMRRMEQEAGRENLSYLSERSDEASLPKSQKIINNIARLYGTKPESTRVLASARMALIYSKEEDKIAIEDIFTAPLKESLTEEQKEKATKHIMNQFKKALKQIGVTGGEVDISELDDTQKQMLQPIIEEIEKENNEKGER